MIHNTDPVQLIHRDLDVVGVGSKILNNIKISRYNAIIRIKFFHLFKVKVQEKKVV